MSISQSILHAIVSCKLFLTLSTLLKPNLKLKCNVPTDLTVDVIDTAGEGLHMTNELRKIPVYEYL